MSRRCKTTLYEILDVFAALFKKFFSSLISIVRGLFENSLIFIGKRSTFEIPPEHTLGFSSSMRKVSCPWHPYIIPTKLTYLPLPSDPDLLQTYCNVILKLFIASTF